MKKLISKISVFILCAVISFAVVFSVSPASAAEPTRNVTPLVFKDGIKAVISFSTENDEVVADISITNQSCNYLGNIVGNIILPEGFKTDKPVSNPITVTPGSSESLTFNISKALPNETPAKNNFVWIIIVAIAVAVIAALAILFFIKKKKSGIAMLLILGIALSFAQLNLPSADAATTERSIVLSDYMTIGEEKYYVQAEIVYEYVFFEEEVEKTTGFKEYGITYFYGPPGYDNMPVTREVLQAIAECGFTTIPLATGIANAKEILNMMKEFNLSCSSLYIGEITDHLIFNVNNTVPEDITQEEVDAVVQKYIDEFEGYDNLLGWNLIDEPSADKFPMLEMLVSAFRRLDPNRETHINIWPCWANSDMLNSPDYYTYMYDYLGNVDPDYLSFDNYHFMSETSSSALRGIPNIFDNLEIIRQYGLEYGKDYMQIVLLTKHLTYANVTPYQLQWEVNMSLTYGSKRVSYFTFYNDRYMAIDCDNACLDYQGNKYPHYYDVQKINKWLMPLGQELFNKTSTKVFHLLGQKADPEFDSENVTKYTSYGDLGAVSGENFVIGFFDDESFMITNKDYYYKVEGVKNAITLNDLKKDLHYFDTNTATWRDVEADGIASRNEKGEYVIEFEPGQGILFKVIN